jgi:hypothetical protein
MYVDCTNSWVFARPKEAALYFEIEHVLRDFLLNDKPHAETLLNVSRDKIEGFSRLQSDCCWPRCYRGSPTKGTLPICRKDKKCRQGFLR